MAKQDKIGLLAVVGPTASGKTALSVALAERLGGEIVSCDSMQVYCGMDIGTAKPTAEERAGIPHYMIDVADPHIPYSAAEYVAAAQACISDIHSRGKLPILCGGTGMYLDSLLRGGFEETATDPALRQSLLDFAAQYGSHALHERLRAVDPESADAIHENNVKRVVRALEIYESTGITKTVSDRLSRTSVSPYRAAVIGLDYPDREILYERIARRVEQMLTDGLVEETRALEAAGVFATNATAAQAIGYKELLPYLRGDCTADEATATLITATRRYAKRQLTWFRAKQYVYWIPMMHDGSVRALSEVLDEAIAYCRSEILIP
ncbi:MAG: tRNA (adenosine(37)-N6)-dimethylallyltransferase MiaA [Clostridia bacterium]|nr:tRNA (adenosine(37)-N6)-dimethylallyltransferase MiaA [Clostridia bacterium]